MNASRQRQPWLFAATAAGLLVSTGFAFLELRAARAAAWAAIANHADCEQLAGQIAKLSAQPSRVTLQTQSASEVARQIEGAAQFAQLPANCLVRIEPLPARRVGDTPYKEQATRVELREASLKQLVQFLHKVHDGESALGAKSLRLAAPPQTATAPGSTENWSVELTLTSLIFAPKNVAPRK